MSEIKFQYVIEFTLPGGKRMKTTIEGTDPNDAVNELFKSIRAKTVIHSNTKPDNDHNRIANFGKNVFDFFKSNKS